MSSAKKGALCHLSQTLGTNYPSPEAYFFGMRRLRVGVFLSIYDPTPPMKFTLSYTPVPEMQSRLGSHVLRGGGGQLLE